jgi:amidohydrolase
MKRILLAVLLSSLAFGASASDLGKAVAADYDAHLAALADHFHRNPELSMLEVKTAERLARELRTAGFTVTEGVGKVGVVAMLKNGPGPLVMLRADMDGLPMPEKTGLPNASTVMQKDMEGNLVPVAHACGHDIHMTSLVGTGRYMAAHKNTWSGTLMLIGQPAEERGLGANYMMKDGLWKRFGQPDYALAFHVAADYEAGKLVAVEGAPYSGADMVDILIRGEGAHGASPHRGKDPIVLGAQIVLALQTIISRELAPREPGVITVGSFHGGSKHNIIGDNAKLQLTVRSESVETRALLLKAIKRVAENTARAAGFPESLLPEVKLVDEPLPPTLNNIALTKRIKKVWLDKLGSAAMGPEEKRLGMGAEDFPQFTSAPYIPSVYFQVGGTPKAELDAAKAKGTSVPSHHSPLFKVSAAPSVKAGVEASVLALQDLLKKP